jgi:hypothetical protein
MLGEDARAVVDAADHEIEEATPHVGRERGLLLRCAGHDADNLAPRRQLLKLAT